VLHLRLIVPTDLVDQVVKELRTTEGVAHLIRIPTTSAVPVGDLVLCDVVREAGNGVIEWLQEMNVHHRGAITVETLETVVSDAAAAAEALAPGHAADALIWEEIEDRARDDATLTASYLVFMSIAAVIAGIGILLDSPVLIVGAMVVGPEYAAIISVALGIDKRDHARVRTGAAALSFGFLLAIVVTLAFSVVVRALGWEPEAFRLGVRPVSNLIDTPNVFSVVVATLAGIVGVVSLVEARTGALIGVFISVTTIPAAADVGVSTAFGDWSEAAGSLVQLLLNVAILTAVGAAGLVVQQRVWREVTRRRQRPSTGR
jgi:uncharacterized hydrophobic protein (TIGR00271 family)